MGRSRPTPAAAATRSGTRSRTAAGTCGTTTATRPRVPARGERVLVVVEHAHADPAQADVDRREGLAERRDRAVADPGQHVLGAVGPDRDGDPLGSLAALRGELDQLERPRREVLVLED